MVGYQRRPEIFSSFIVCIFHIYSASHLKVALENVGLKKYKSAIHLHVIPVWKEVTGGAGNVIPERQCTTEQDVACFWRWVPGPLVSPHECRAGCSPVTNQVCVVCSCRHTLLDDPTGESQVGSNLVTLEAIVLVKLLCLGKIIRLQPCSRQKCGLWPHLVGDNWVWVPDHLIHKLSEEFSVHLTCYNCVKENGPNYSPLW
jgi:hypothetical protein